MTLDERCDDVVSACLAVPSTTTGVSVARRVIRDCHGEGLVVELSGVEVWRAVREVDDDTRRWTETWAEGVMSARPDLIIEADRRTSSRPATRRS